jgi:drug/metabolite transporter (DMT)-like permease
VTAETAVALLLFGCIPVVIRYVEANPYTIGIVRLAIASAGLALLMRGRSVIRPLSRVDLARLTLIGALFFAHWIAYFFAIKISSASIGTIGLSTYGIHLLILGSIFGGSRFTIADAVAVALAIVGVLLTVPEFSLGNRSTVGILLGTASALFYAALPILHQRWSHMSSSVRALGQFSVALVCFLLFLPKADWTLRPIDWAGLAFLGFASTLVGHGLWVRITTRLRPATTSIVYYGSVPIALVLAVIVLGEPLTGRTIVGAALIVGGGVVGLYHQWSRSRELLRAAR